MARISEENISTLYTADQLASTASTAKEEVQLLAIACLCNRAANNGLYSVEYTETIYDANRVKLRDNGYILTDMDATKLLANSRTLISWKKE